MDKNLTAFLAQNAKKIDNVKYVASSRFVNAETGDPVEWEIRCITAAENAALRKACMRSVPVIGRKGQYTQEFDTTAYMSQLAVCCTVFPNLNDGELMASYHINGAAELLTTMLTPAEFDNYTTKVMEVNGFQTGAEMVNEAKN